MDLWKRKFCPFAESIGSEASGFSAKEKSGFKWESDQLELLLLWVCLLWDISLPTPLGNSGLSILEFEVFFRYTALAAIGNCKTGVGIERRKR